MEHLAKKSKEEKKIVASKKVKPFKLSFMDPARVNKFIPAIKVEDTETEGEAVAKNVN